MFVGARFRPGAGGAALGLPLSELRDLRVGLDDLDRALAERLPADLEPREALRRLAEIALAAPPADAAVAEAARRLQQPQARVETLAGDLGLSERQLRRRCHAAAGYGPKTLQRVLRFRRFLAARTATSPAPRSTPATPTSRTSRASAPASPGGRPPRCCADEARRGRWRSSPLAGCGAKPAPPAVSGPAASCATPPRSPSAQGRRSPAAAAAPSSTA